MFERISNGFSPLSNGRVLTKDNTFIVFPIVSVSSPARASASSYQGNAGGSIGNQFQQHHAAEEQQQTAGVGVRSPSRHFCTYFVIIFCNSALISCALLRFNGENPRLADGFRMALARLPQPRVLFAPRLRAYCSRLSRALTRRWGRSSPLLWTAWSIMTFFVVLDPVVEKVGLMAAVLLSAAAQEDVGEGASWSGTAGPELHPVSAAGPRHPAVRRGASSSSLRGQTVPGIVLLVVAGIAFLIHGDQLGVAHGSPRRALPVRGRQPRARRLRPTRDGERVRTLLNCVSAS